MRESPQLPKFDPNLSILPILPRGGNLNPKVLTFCRRDACFRMLTLVFLFLAISPLFGCSQTQTKKINAELEKNMQRWGESKISNSDEQTASPSQFGFYKGCWTSNNGNGMLITDVTIQTRNSRRPLRYKDITDGNAIGSGVRLLEILDEDESNELQRYLTLKPLPAGEMEAKDYVSYEHFSNNTADGVHSRWVRDKCKVVRPTLHH
jgi:hypothetical protein